jgi:hypothetical protein
MQACKLIMFYYACTHVRSRVWSGSAAKGVLRKRAQIGAPVRKGTQLNCCLLATEQQSIFEQFSYFLHHVKVRKIY